MAMRITTKMMQSRSLINLNTNKALQEKLTTQMSTMKKITRPSDDPVIAIRSLKLNSSLNRIDQYYEKNAKDAESWLDLTESAIGTTSTILTSMRSYIVQASQGSLEASDRAAILENLSNFRKEIYATGNADSDGRSIFTGYRTNTSLTFTEDKTEKYEITEQWSNACIGSTTFVKTGDLGTLNEGNFNSTTKKTTEYEVESYEVPRIRLAYDDLDYDVTDAGVDEAKINVSFFVDTEITPKDITNPTADLGVTVSTTSYSIFLENNGMGVTIKDALGNIATDAGGDAIDGIDLTAGDITLADGSTILHYDTATNSIVIQENSSKAGVGNPYKTTTLGVTTNSDGTFTYDKQYETKLTVTDKVSSGTICDPDTGDYTYAYDDVIGDANADNIIYVAETGELLLGSNIQAQLAGLSVSSEIRITYEKSDWEAGDLDPIHYFNTKKYSNANATATNYEANRSKYIEYNADKLTDPDGTNANQVIEYDIGNNQSIRVNTTADELFTHDMGRDVDEVITMLNQFVTLDETYEKVETMIDSGKYEGEELEKLEAQLLGLDKARALAKDKVQKTCEGLMTTFDGYINQTTLAYTEAGSRSSRLQLIQNRLGKQQTNFEELVSENEDADLTDLAIQLKSVELTYEAALASISYVMKTTLLNYI